MLLSRSKLTQGSVSESKLRGELEVLVAMVAECYPDSLLYSLKQQSVKPQDESICPSYHTKEKIFTPAKCREWVHFIDDLNMPQDQHEKVELVDFDLLTKDVEFFKSTFMPVIF